MLSTAHSAPRARARPATAAMSTISSLGLVGLSTHTSRVEGFQPASSAEASVRSTGVKVRPAGSHTSARSR